MLLFIQRMGIDALEVKRLLGWRRQAEGRTYFADREVVAQVMYGVQKQIATAVIDFTQGFDGGQRSLQTNDHTAYLCECHIYQHF